MKTKQIEDELMAHRYLYYVLADPVISDFEYDLKERNARVFLPKTSPIHGVGSSLSSSYNDRQKQLAKQMQDDSI